MSRPAVLLVSCYELGRQPLSLAWARAFLERAGHACRSIDLSVERLDPEAAAGVSLIAISVPMHTALRLGLKAGERLRALSPEAHICYFGLYAWLHAERLLAGPADSVAAGEAEEALVDLADALARGAPVPQRPGLSGRAGEGEPALSRLELPTPRRDGLPPLNRYAAYDPGSGRVLAGHVEASRGCLHTCRHCPVVPVYGGRFFAVPVGVVMADVAQQVEVGARHISFGDPDFLNGPTHALRVARALHAAHPDVSFDFTAKVEHLLRHRGLLPELVAAGARFAVSAVESLSDTVLQRLQKGHRAADADRLVEVLDDVGLALHPTFVAFTPWTRLEDYLAQLDYVERHDLPGSVPPVQHSVRLLVPPGSPLAQDPGAAEWLGPLAPDALSRAWVHPDARMDALQQWVEARVREAAAVAEDPETTFAAIRAEAFRAAGRQPPPIRERTRRRGAPPRLTEDWFC